MKKILTAAFIVGAASAAAILLLTRRTPEERAADDVADAATNAYDTMNTHLNRVEAATEKALGTN